MTLSTLEKRSPIPRLIARAYLRQIDESEVYRLAETYDGRLIDHGKYADVQTHVLRQARAAVGLGLHRRFPLRVLDIGSGFGYFLAVAQFLGHQVTGVDLPRASGQVAAFYEDACKLLGVRRVDWVVRPDAEVPPLAAGPFDLITAWQITFNGHNTSQLWGVAEWSGFLMRLAGLCSLRGEIVLSFNTERRSGQFINSDLSQYLDVLGARRQRNLVRLRARRILSSRVS